MKRISASGVMLSLLISGSAFADEPRCPVLKHGQGIEWTYQQGPDFGLCYATDKVTKADLFGLYFGFAPQFHPEKSTSIGDGTIANKRIIWYSADGEKAKTMFKKQALLEISKNNFVHAWISATTEADMKRAEDALADMELRK